MTANRHVILNLNPIPGGIYAGAWRSGQRDPASFVSIEHYVELARIAERGLFDAFFLADRASWSPAAQFATFRPLDPTVTLPFIAAQTTHIGLIATVSTTYNTPYNLARRILTLDHVSKGRAGWNVVVTAGDDAARNFSLDAAPSKPQRYARAREFVEIVRALWSSWEDGALLADAESGRYVDIAKVHAIDYRGEHLSVQGPLVLHPSPQGSPVILQAGGSEDGTDLAARHAHGVYSSQPTFAGAHAYRQELRRRAVAYGRHPDTIKLIPGFVTVIGDTEEAAQKRARDLLDMSAPEAGLNSLSHFLQLPKSLFQGRLDEPLPWKEIPPESLTGVGHGATLLRGAKEKNLTVRELIREVSAVKEHATIVGTPEQVADRIAEWFLGEAVDGFNIMPAELPRGAEDFVDHVVPLLQKRDLFRRAYEHTTLRGHLGLAKGD